jgi:hypothetical protein
MKRGEYGYLFPFMCCWVFHCCCGSATQVGILEVGWCSNVFAQNPAIKLSLLAKQAPVMVQKSSSRFASYVSVNGFIPFDPLVHCFGCVQDSGVKSWHRCATPSVIVMECSTARRQQYKGPSDPTYVTSPVAEHNLRNWPAFSYNFSGAGVSGTETLDQLHHQKLHDFIGANASNSRG